MNMWDQAILSQVMSLAQKDADYQSLLCRCRELEEFYCRVMEELSPDQRDAIDTYFFSCSELNFRIITLAFHWGQSSARRKTPL